MINPYLIGFLNVKNLNDVLKLYNLSVRENRSMDNNDLMNTNVTAAEIISFFLNDTAQLGIYTQVILK